MAEETAGHKGRDSGAAPKRKRTATADRFSHHTCWHHDAWQGLLMMPPAEVGVYWRIILLMYIRRGPLADDDRDLAHACHTDLRTYRRIKASLVERGRIVVDAENGIVFDERTVRELVDAGFFSETQTERAMKRHASGRTRNGSQNPPHLCGKSAPTLVENDTPSLSNQRDGLCRTHANQYPIPIESSSESEEPLPCDGVCGASAPSLPLNGGGRASKRREHRKPIPIEDPAEREALKAAAVARMREQLGEGAEA